MRLLHIPQLLRSLLDKSSPRFFTSLHPQLGLRHVTWPVGYLLENLNLNKRYLENVWWLNSMDWVVTLHETPDLCGEIEVLDYRAIFIGRYSCVYKGRMKKTGELVR
jgi:hypothetical protein